ncbi:MAG TPA: HD domain-containing phosphohydrolase [Thermoleophilia bacterium]|nr:HD domain-containing phosphohydrolase [Thermoleophilia bacterium]
MSGQQITPLPRCDTAARDEERRLVHRLAVALRTTGFHDPGNTSVQGAIAEFLRTVRTRWAHEQVWVGVRNRCVFVNDERLRIGPSDYLNVRYLMDTYDRWGLGGVTFQPGLRDGEMRSLLYELNQKSERGLEELDARAWALGLKHVELTEPERESEEPAAHLPLRTYSACLDVCREIQETVREHRHIRTRRLRRVTQAVVDQLLEDESALLSMTTIKEFDDYLFTHSTNVAILSVALGQRLGFDKRTLGDLCLAAFLHDLGKILVPREILNKPTELDSSERAEMRQHPIHSVILLLEQEQLNQSTLRAIVAGFEHHVNLDLSGYPRLTRKDSVTLFGRIICLADRYDAITTQRKYRKTTSTPHEGMRFLLEHSGSQFEPVLVKLFLEMLGVYPPGTVVGLNTGEVGVVRRPPLPGSALSRPQVRVVRGGDPGAILDLAERDTAGNHPRSVVAVLNPDNNGQLPALCSAEIDALGPIDAGIGDDVPTSPVRLPVSR